MLPNDRERLLLAPYAMSAFASLGRRVPEVEHPYRSPYQRDRDRITHSAAFRRLSEKTQVFTRVGGERGLGDYHRTRLTHTLEVASVARTVARALAVNEDLVEALALAHDLGHPPFGHAGEEVLDKRLAPWGGFNHNRQALRLVELLEERYPDRAGLNLTAEVLEGQRGRGEKRARSVECLSPEQSREGHGVGSPLVEAQVVDAADSVAYDSHDADDALEVGLVTLADLDESLLWRESVARVRRRWSALDGASLRRATIHDLIDRQVNDLVESARRRLAEAAVAGVESVRAAPLLVAPSAELAEQKLGLEGLLFRRVYRHPSVLEQREAATEALGQLFEKVLDRVGQLPAVYRRVAEDESPERAAGDWVSSLTDRAVLGDSPLRGA
ncbi:MAG: dGTP triphosphohydrolase [Lacipirellulaceae bacterium]